MNYLLFILFASMGSWGEIAVGVNRHTANHPSKSAITGLLGAGLGVKRDDEDAQQALAQDYLLAVEQVGTGDLLNDFHTAQVPRAKDKFRYRTRRDEIVIGRDRLETIVTNREYRTGAVSIVAIAANGCPVWSLEELRQALLTPEYHLYLGRKSCPLGAPLQPEIIEADDFLQALTRYNPEPILDSHEEDQRYLQLTETSHYYWEGELQDFATPDRVAPNQVQQSARRDYPLSRTQWQFKTRQENLWIGPRSAGNLNH